MDNVDTATIDYKPPTETQDLCHIPDVRGLSLREAALAYVAAGIPCFPCWPNSKKPMTANGFHDASTSPAQIDMWWTATPDANIAFTPHSVGWGIVDIDSPEAEIEFGIASKDDPETWVVRTPRGGLHLYYQGELPTSVARRVIPGQKIDTRGRGSYALLPPSRTEHGTYEAVTTCDVAPLPAWISAAIAETAGGPALHVNMPVDLDQPANVARAVTYLKQLAPVTEGQGADERTYTAACAVRDCGVSAETAEELMLEHYQCEPKDNRFEAFIARKIANAYRYGQNDVGVHAITTTAAETFGAAVTDLEDGDWPEPENFMAAKTLAPELRPEHLPDTLWPFVTDTAERMGVDPATIALGTLVTCASVINDDWELRPKRHDDWTQPARLWGLIVGDPSIKKTPVLTVTTKPLDRLEESERRAYEEKMARHKKAHAEWKAWIMKGTIAPEPAAPKRPRRIVENITTETLAEVLRNVDDPDGKQYAPARKVLVRQDEMTEFFGNLGRYSGGKAGGDRGPYLKLYNGLPYYVDRAGRGSFTVSHFSACFIGGVQPDPLQTAAKASDDDGLLQRFMFIVPDHQRGGVDREPDRKAAEDYERLVFALATLEGPSSGPGGRRLPVTLAEGAHAYRLVVEAIVDRQMARADTSSRMKSTLSKWEALFARLLLTFHMIEETSNQAMLIDAGIMDAFSPRMEVPEETAARVAGFMRDIWLPHLRRAEAIMAGYANTSHAAWIAGHILARGLARVRVSDITSTYRALKERADRGTLLGVLDGLVSDGWLKPEETDSWAKPCAAWTVNPKAHLRFADQAAREKCRRQETVDKIRTDGLARRARETAEAA